MRTRTCVALAAALLATASPAHAANDSVYQGGCTLSAQPDPKGEHSWTGVLSGAVWVYSPTTPQDNPVSADLVCDIRVNGTPVDLRSSSGTTVVTQSKVTAFTRESWDVVHVCTTVDYTSNTTATAGPTCVVFV